LTFILSSTFTDSLAKLTSEEQKVVKTTSFDLQVNPANPGHQFHKLERARDKAFWSVRVSSDIRIIVHRTEQSLMLCYVDHHDKAYAWAERRKLEVHPQTGAAQIVEIRETVQEIFIPKYVEQERSQPPLFQRCSDVDLLSWGVPAEWLGDVRTATEDNLLTLATHLPAEASEALLEFATGGKPQPKPGPQPQADPFTHPDALRRFQVMASSEQLQQALEASWEKWVVFLHPDQQQLVERDYSGPARVSGSAGTGKTIVALHRAVHLARTNPDGRVLLATFTSALAHALKDKLNRLIVSQPRLGERIEVHSMVSLGLRWLDASKLKKDLISPEDFQQLLTQEAKAIPGHLFTASFLITEWEDVVEAWDIQSWEGYRDVLRLGRKIKLPEAVRQTLWSIFSLVREALDTKGLITEAGLFNHLSRQLAGRAHPPFDFVVVDEAQDISLPQLRFFAAFGAQAPNRLFFTGDIAQRIFRSPYSWKAAGIDLRGRSKTLKVNYRTSHQIRVQADRLLNHEVTDGDGNVESRKQTISVFQGPMPNIETFADSEAEVGRVVAWIRDLVQQGVQPQEIALIVRNTDQIPRAHEACMDSGLPFVILDDQANPVQGKLSVVTMHLAKGMEFRAVAVMACDAEVIPSPERLELATDPADLEEIFNTERHLLYVACTRARDYLLVTSRGEPSEFLEDFMP
jgi:ATP-dependent exoDNAse (exonuclease V) beta subunit/mRNA-degrading endonuclease RelE of RelBE toxin-antitoxin system